MAGGARTQRKHRFAAGIEEPLEAVLLSGAADGGVQFLLPRHAGSVSGIFESSARFRPKTVSIIAISYNIASIIGGVFFGSLSEKIGRKKAIIIAALLALPVIPLWAFSSGSLMLGIGAFLMQFMVQGAWGVIPTYLTELVPANTRAVLPGFVYQLGNLIASVNATLQATIAEHHGHNYGLAMAIVAATVAVAIALLVFFGKDTRGKAITDAVKNPDMRANV